jgi:hypothetical protein
MLPLIGALQDTPEAVFRPPALWEEKQEQINRRMANGLLYNNR